MGVGRRCFSLILFIFGATPGFSQAPPMKVRPKTIALTVCEILKDPSAYNNKMVRVRGVVKVSAEYSMLEGEECSDGIWFALGDGSAPPGLVAIVNGRGSAGGTDAKGKRIPPVAVHLLRDSNYRELMRYLETSAKGESCADRLPPSGEIPDCRMYRVTATLIGRIDGVSKAIHAAHLNRSSRDRVDGKGFGQMGMFDAQLVVQSVEDVVAVDDFKTSSTRHVDDGDKARNEWLEKPEIKSRIFRRCRRRAGWVRDSSAFR